MKEVKLRRYENLLTLSGLGVIAFGAWSVLKALLFMLYRGEVFEPMLADIADNRLAKLLVFVIVAVVLLFVFAVRLYVGLSARAEGHGRKKGVVYVVIAILMALFSVLSLLSIFFDSEARLKNSMLEIIVSFVVETTSLIVIVELLVAAFTVKKLRKELEEVQ